MVEKRLFHAFKDFQINKNIVDYTHFGIIMPVLRALNFEIYPNNCGVVAFTADNSGAPENFYGYWNNFN